MEIQERVRLALEHAVKDGVLPMEYALTIYAEIFPPDVKCPLCGKWASDTDNPHRECIMREQAAAEIGAILR